jgi:hypothetical protein
MERQHASSYTDLYARPPTLRETCKTQNAAWLFDGELSARVQEGIEP